MDKMYTHKLLVEIDTLDIENVALFGFRLAGFHQSHPDVDFEWGEAYNEHEEDDEYGGDEDDDARETAIFQIVFKTQEGRKSYLDYRVQSV
ncbi:hypothetical protein MMSR116_08180 [Methylobacterium mesophilicum SR1.6/6]|uniref:Uncharacterized protein n=1 Tax=Methylobacterium mesophilicum SR1.6/6 TaxID=908290 RepID=A0A6B9FIS4_9HYPH|nr:hypothetical protein [Methylobacterium mesophilicum]QGY01859.1 hypothetical protein MMSR116_08180 [Methylobacterium mesophilicum SR1.6/6]